MWGFPEHGYAYCGQRFAAYLSNESSANSSYVLAIQGIGGGGCNSVTEIVYADIIPLPERGKFLGIVAS